MPKKYSMGYTKKCPKCKMEIDLHADICPYCRTRLKNSWGLPSKEALGLDSGGSSNNGCMVVLPLIMVFAASAGYLITLFV